MPKVIADKMVIVPFYKLKLQTQRNSVRVYNMNL